jgi:hypothetical protein
LRNDLSSIISEEDLKTVFCNLEELFGISERLLKELREEEAKAPEEQEIGRIFLSFV